LVAAGATFFGMLPFCLYFVAGVATGFHVYTLLALTVYGAPFNSLELVSLLGSVGLLIAAFISLFKPYAAARIALIACLMTWSFYGPAIANVVRSKLDKHSALSANPNSRWTQPFALVRR
jgi:phosphoglycerol transferase MdoB-like AlkP superfamily enzyme